MLVLTPNIAASIDLQMIFDLTAKKLIGYEPSKSSECLRKNFVAFIRGLISFPLNIPGTAYHQCMEVITWSSFMNSSHQNK
jgi:hypothetical protein